MPETKFKHRLV